MFNRIFITLLAVVVTLTFNTNTAKAQISTLPGGDVYLPANKYFLMGSNDRNNRSGSIWWSASHTGVDYDESFLLRGDKGTQTRLRAIKNGNIAIGQWTPSYKLDVNGTARVNTLINTSDIRLKTDIKKLGGCLSKVTKLNGLTYYLNEGLLYEKSLSPEEQAINKSLGSNVKNTEKKVFKKGDKHIGFSAQEIQKVFPEIVHTDKDGYLGVDYIALIPVLVESIKEQQGIIAGQQQEIEELKALVKNMLQKPVEAPANQLFQNSPNPFHQNTTIQYQIGQDTRSAVIYIYDMQGNPVKEIEITEKGQGSVTLEANKLKKGMYIYGLVVDGKEVEVKRLILTK